MSAVEVDIEVAGTCGLPQAGGTSKAIGVTRRVSVCKDVAIGGREGEDIEVMRGMS